jgi:phosphatidylglycerol:prolipoprotein diacylglycerol transferase
MHPILFEYGPITVYAYGLFIATAFLAGLGWSTREARMAGLNHALIQDLGFMVIISAVIGARLLYVLINPTYFLAHPGEAILFWNGGLVFQGGFIAAVGTGWWFLRRHDQPVLPWIDALAPGLALGQAIGRIGCFMAGCCYGAHCELPWAVTFTDIHSLAPVHTPLHPTQLYHVLAGLITFMILITAGKRFRHPGNRAGLFLILYAAARIGIEFFRSDYRGHFGPFSVTQVIAFGVLLLGIGLFRLRKTK